FAQYLAELNPAGTHIVWVLSGEDENLPRLDSPARQRHPEGNMSSDQQGNRCLAGAGRSSRGIDVSPLEEAIDQVSWRFESANEVTAGLDELRQASCSVNQRPNGIFSMLHEDVVRVLTKGRLGEEDAHSFCLQSKGCRLERRICTAVRLISIATNDNRGVRLYG